MKDVQTTKVFVLSMLVAVLPVLAQSPTFEVAIVKAAVPYTTEDLQSGKAHIGLKVDAGRVDIGSSPLASLIMNAYRLKQYELDAPEWTRNRPFFDVLAKIPAGVTEAQMPEMLQALLKDRFKLAVHREMRDRAFYALVVSKNGPRLKEAAAGAPMLFKGTAVDPRGISHIHTISNLSALAFAMGPYVDRPVIDMTKLTGVNDMDLDVSRDPELGIGAMPLLDFKGAVKALGLELEARKEAIEMLVVDHVEKMPTEN
jgi:uncharacterized protein (TIGR03435 family)